MKKSNSLMLAYVIFLIITVIASLFSWNGISSIACGATIAGCLFSFADLTNRYSSYYKKFIEPYKEDREVQHKRALLFKESLTAQIEDANKALEILKPHCEDEKISQVILGTEKYISDTNNTLLEVDSIANDTFIIESIIAMENGVKQLEKREIKLLIAGYVLFFCIVVFDYLECLFEPVLSTLTVFAFEKMDDVLIEDQLELWYQNGGYVTHKHWKRLRKDLREEIIQYLHSLPLNYDVELNGRHYKLVHGAPVEEYEYFHRCYANPTHFAVWKRWRFFEEQHGDYVLVFGHTPTIEYTFSGIMEIWFGNHRIGIDCGSGYPEDASHPYNEYGRLACLRLDDMKAFYSEERFGERGESN